MSLGQIPDCNHAAMHHDAITEIPSYFLHSQETREMLWPFALHTRCYLFRALNVHFQMDYILASKLWLSCMTQ